ncbi:MAG: hypothetical protein H6581_02730 [Bacteroidia bacterium]|nr:hypothetical protein [Bacteroidia bacterium]
MRPDHLLLSLICFLGLFSTGFAQADPGIVPDSRIYNHYSPEQVSEMMARQPAKIRKLNYYFQESWYVEPEANCNDCPEIDKSQVDIMEYDSYRQATRENRVKLTAPGHHIVLRPWSEVRAQYELIK